jgi:hypothetical protein
LWEVEDFRDTVNFAVVRVEFVEFYRFGLVLVDEFKNAFHFFFCERAVQPFEDFLELVDPQFPALVCVVSDECPVQRDLLDCQNVVQLYERFLHFHLQL